MFTGLIETLGTVQQLACGQGQPCEVGRRLTITAPTIARELKVGDSVAVNGVCLTVVLRDDDAFRFEVGPETLRRTNLGALQPGDKVNLERALRIGDRLGGHFVQGHVDDVGTIAQRLEEGDWVLLWISCPAALTQQMVPKGSIAVDGISLTLVDVGKDRFSVALIPHTLSLTTLGFKQVGETVNLETDILAKYVCKQLQGESGRGNNL